MTDDNDLHSRIEAAREKAKPKSKEDSAMSASGAAVRALGYSFALVAAMGVGGIIGHTIDFFLGTGPWGLLIFLAFGAVAGFLNIFREAKRMAEEAAKAYEAKNASDGK
jgi:ATP synthase protein I